MRQEREPIRSSFEQGKDLNPLRWSFNDVAGGIYRTNEEQDLGERLEEIRFGLHQESNNHGREGGDSKDTHDQRSDGSEPFLNLEFKEEDLFVNSYGGNYAQVMQLNRKGVERVLKIAHLEGKVHLTNLQPNRSRAEVHGNELAAKRRLFFAEKIEDNAKENPLYRVVSTPEGWRIAINDRRIMEDLNEKKLTGEKLQRTFIKKFNQLLNKSVFECIRKEKTTGIKDKYFIRKALIVAINPGTTLSLWASGVFHLDTSLTTYFVIAVGSNLVGLLGKLQTERLGIFSSAYIGRKLDAPWEYLMPQVEIDKVARAYAYLTGKGRTLVREVGKEG